MGQDFVGLPKLIADGVGCQLPNWLSRSPKRSQRNSAVYGFHLGRKEPVAVFVSLSSLQCRGDSWSRYDRTVSKDKGYGDSSRNNSTSLPGIISIT